MNIGILAFVPLKNIIAVFYFAKTLKKVHNVIVIALVNEKLTKL